VGWAAVCQQALGEGYLPHAGETSIFKSRLIHLQPWSDLECLWPLTVVHTLVMQTLRRAAEYLCGVSSIAGPIRQVQPNAHLGSARITPGRNRKDIGDMTSHRLSMSCLWALELSITSIILHK